MKLECVKKVFVGVVGTRVPSKNKTVQGLEVQRYKRDEPSPDASLNRKGCGLSKCILSSGPLRRYNANNGTKRADSVDL
ncbi:hypothetical protein JTE90_004792 [Oedothorax gibbosus]|uniref:Uncharacterized protein n=1 Tax=Oedothorax gibbosus TaxID=931172 RepID=A0AAV6VI11_9ARAC|nr:hypothetical protein JTE90_004792 [Oedothorax gibbosus]